MRRKDLSMPILGRSLRAELADGIGIKSLRKELRMIGGELKKLRVSMAAFDAEARKNQRPTGAPHAAGGAR